MSATMSGLAAAFPPSPPPAPPLPGLPGSSDPRSLALSMMPSPRFDAQMEPVDSHPNPEHRDKLARWADMDNIAEDEELDDKLDTIGARVKTDYDIDENTRSDWKEKYRKWLDMALQVAEKKTYPWPDASNVIYPLMTTAAIQFAARAYPAIIRDRNVVKGTVLGNDKGVPAPPQPQGPPPGMLPPGMMPPPGAMPPGAGPGGMPPGAPPGMMMNGAPPGAGPGMPPPGMVGPGMGPPQQQWLIPPGARQERADRIGRHMSWQLLNEQEEWEPQTDTLLIALPIVGTYFRKSYFDSALGRNVSETVTALDMCVNYHAKSFDTAPRQTEIVRLYPWEIEANIRSGLFLEYGEGAEDYGHDNDGENGSSQNDDDAPTTFLEQHRRYDLDKDGYAEPYIITVARDSGKLARIRAGFEMDGVKWTAAGKVRLIEKTTYYTKYGFIPSPDSKVYDLGFGHLLFPINEAVNTTLNQMFDAGHLQNVGGGFIGSGLSINTGAIRFQMGEYKPVNTLGGTIRDNVFPIPFPGPSGVLMELLKFLVEAGERVASVKDVMVGDMPGDNTSGITTLAVIEQGLKVFSAIYKRVHRSLGYEFKKLYRLNRLYGQPTMQYESGDSWEEVTREDYERGAGVQPISDPQMVTDMQRLGRAQFLLTFKDDPRVDGKKVLRRAFAAAMITDVDDLIIDQPPPPDPKVLLKNRELDIREKREMIDLMLRQEHDKALIVKEIAAAELSLAQARKLDNDAEISWVEQRLQHLRDQVDAISSLSSALGPTNDAGGGGSDAAAA